MPTGGRVLEVRGGRNVAQKIFLSLDFIDVVSRKVMNPSVD